MEEIIRPHLNEIEASEKVRVVYACESGSRAWGFPSADSDYDVRFVYVRPAEWYLSVDVGLKREVIERPTRGGWDGGGGNWRKPVLLLKRWTPPLLEWLGSPIVYRE